MFKSHYTTLPSPRSHLNLLGVCSSEVTVVLLSFLRWILLSVSLYCTFVFRFVFFCELLHSRVVITLFLYRSIYIYTYIYLYLCLYLYLYLYLTLSLISVSTATSLPLSLSVSLPLSLRVSSCVHFLLHCPISHSTHPVRCLCQSCCFLLTALLMLCLFMPFLIRVAFLLADCFFVINA